MTSRIAPEVLFRVNGTVLYQDINAPHEIVAAPADFSLDGTGGYARADEVSGVDSIAISGSTVGADIWECQTVGSARTTPVTAGLMQTSHSWEVSLDEGLTWVPARALSVKPSNARIGWIVNVEVPPT
ncbi:MAG: hypothetical protein AAGA46_00290 [Cyanobacteria bacterium P01_F01_bin.13]